jgi:energy-coupling factor transporter ATP-binding protein EcfA2
MELRIKEALNRPVFYPNRRCALVNDVLMKLSSNDHLYVCGALGFGKTELLDHFVSFFLLQGKY